MEDSIDRTHRTEFELRELIADQIEIYETEFAKAEKGEEAAEGSHNVIGVLELLEGFLEGLDPQEAHEWAGKHGAEGFWRSRREAGALA